LKVYIVEFYRRLIGIIIGDGRTGFFH